MGNFQKQDLPEYSIGRAGTRERSKPQEQPLFTKVLQWCSRSLSALGHHGASAKSIGTLTVETDSFIPSHPPHLAFYRASLRMLARRRWGQAERRCGEAEP